MFRSPRSFTPFVLSVSLAVSSAACSSAPAIGVRADTPPLPTLQEGVERTEETFAGVKGVTLFGRGYRPKTGEVRGVVVFMNGLKDHGDNYAAVSQQLTKRGYAAYAFDLRGEGRSSGARVEVDKFDDYVDDLARYEHASNSSKMRLAAVSRRSSSRSRGRELPLLESTSSSATCSKKQRGWGLREAMRALLSTSSRGGRPRRVEAAPKRPAAASSTRPSPRPTRWCRRMLRRPRSSP